MNNNNNNNNLNFHTGDRRTGRILIPNEVYHVELFIYDNSNIKRI